MHKHWPSHAIVHRYSVSSATDNRSTLWGNFVPKLKIMSGFVAVYTFDDTEHSEGISLTLWDSKAAAQGYIESEVREVLDKEAAAFRPATDRRIMRILDFEDMRLRDQE